MITITMPEWIGWLILAIGILFGMAVIADWILILLKTKIKDQEKQILESLKKLEKIGKNDENNKLS